MKPERNKTKGDGIFILWKVFFQIQETFSIEHDMKTRDSNWFQVLSSSTGSCLKTYFI